MGRFLSGFVLPLFLLLGLKFYGIFELRQQCYLPFYDLDFLHFSLWRYWYPYIVLELLSLALWHVVALYLYALCVNTGLSYIWVVMLIYTEYLCQISIQHCGLRIHISILLELGFPEHKIKSSFLISNLPLFLVYLYTLLQSSITARDIEWALVTRFIFFLKRSIHHDPVESIGWKDILQQMVSPVIDASFLGVSSLYRYWQSLIQGEETPPYFVQLSIEVDSWPEDGIQRENIESRINLLKAVYDMRCKEQSSEDFHSPSRVRVQSIERSQENPKLGLAVFEVINAAPLTESATNEWFESLSPAADAANEIIKALRAGFIKEIGFPYPILSVIGGGKWELISMLTYFARICLFSSWLSFSQSVIKNKVEFLEIVTFQASIMKWIHWFTLADELRCLLDWSCATTSLTMYDWLKLEDIHASLVLVKCNVNLNRANR
ncbi:Piezo non-specific cation channel, R-Ras-binding domain [Dillenia turbinata]|uniref:Piezo non-specific cation channel, R-Ras-binding domain n=1 Tax=Dillenia turbinata TaxID=194707 RepID=A0AAN8U9T3_9MAGN